MSERICVLLTCASNKRWAIPQSCLGEILTVAADEDSVPAEVNWRGVDIPVMDFGAGGREVWRDPQSSAGLIAVILGVKGQGFKYWGVALRGRGLAMRDLQECDCQDKPDAIQEYSLAAFELEGQTYQVPDLPALQCLTIDMDTAASA
jgi:hypothetical protein